MKKTFILLLAIWLCGVCGVQAAQLNKVAAVFNGQVITMFDLQKTALPELGRARLNPNNPAQAKEVDKVFRKVLDMMIMDILLACLVGSEMCIRDRENHGHGSGPQGGGDPRRNQGILRSP